MSFCGASLVRLLAAITAGSQTTKIPTWRNHDLSPSGPLRPIKADKCETILSTKPIADSAAKNEAIPLISIGAHKKHGAACRAAEGPAATGRLSLNDPTEPTLVCRRP